jgi:iron complex outermembrane recepter protein
MKPILLCLSILLLASFYCFSQENPADSSKTLNEVIIKAYEQNRKLVEVAAPVSFTGQGQLNRFGNSSILPALNITPGVSMEERSPGSYRLNIRGSSLRSQFGVRDVKIYLNEIPLTDPSGNTYLNQLSFYNFNSIEIIKGPASSLYGAGIGGAMLIHTLPDNWYRGVSLDYSVASFNATNINVNVKTGDTDHENNFNYSHQNSDGYRVQAKMRRDIASWESSLKVSDKQTLHAYISYSDLFYQTPGGLTLAQYIANPKQARPAGALPSAVQAKAAIYQKTFLAGFSNEYKFNENWQNTTSVYGSYTDFINPGVRVYEIRKEPHFGGRSVFEYKKQIGNTGLQLNFGTEAQKGFFNTSDYGNKQGVADSLQLNDNINMWQYMVFAQLDLKFNNGWIITGGASFNRSALEFINLLARPTTTVKRTFDNKVPPHLGVLKKITKDISVYGSVARGFSTPTVSEMLRSDGLFGTTPLQPEDGMDYEVGARGTLFHNKLYFDANVFFFDLKNTIVERIDSFGVFYYVNAGSTKQNGIETYASYQLTDNRTQFINSAKLWISYAWHDFHYGNFKQDTILYSKNKLPGVSPQTVVAGLDITSKNGCYINITYNYTDQIALNDANSAYAPSYSLLGARLGYRKNFHRKIKAEIFVGADNMLDTKYSLGNDFNATGGRYYNAAAGRNYYAGLSLKWLK